MAYSFTEKKRIRYSFGKHQSVLDIPYLLSIQIDSYKEFLQADIPPEQRQCVGLQAAFNAIFPIKSSNDKVVIEFLSYEIDQPTFDVYECQVRGVTYGAPLRANLRLKAFQKEGDIKEFKYAKDEQVYMGDIPLMTDKGTFIINGTERVIVSQMQRSPGVIFEHDKGKVHSSGKKLHSARIIPARGSWLDFEFDPKDILYARIDRKRKFLATTLLHALGMRDAEILAEFYRVDRYRFVDKETLEIAFDPKNFVDTHAPFDIYLDNKVLVENGHKINKGHIKKMQNAGIQMLRCPTWHLLNKVLAEEVVVADGEVYSANTQITEEMITQFIDNDVKELALIFISSADGAASFLSDTLSLDQGKSQSRAQMDVYNILRPGEPPTEEGARTLFEGLFFDAERSNYDLSVVGRMKFNRRVGRESSEGSMLLSKEDIVDVIRVLLNIVNDKDRVDDIDHLGNRRVRAVGELVENQVRLGLVRLEKNARERLNMADEEKLTPKDIINSKPVTGAIKEFFATNQLSQFMDQTNPLSEITNKRRISALGPGGLQRERAGFEVRDVHVTHYGRVCPIETPEGQNIGLINSLAMYARLNAYGFIETPYRKVIDGKVTNQVEFLSAIDESRAIIAQAKVPVDHEARMVGELVPCREKGEFTELPPDRMTHVDVSPRQIVSVAASLIPFLEHDDANRALMGSNMQRQAVPVLIAEKPFSGTGVERVVARDSGAVVVAKRPGVVCSVDSARIAVRLEGEMLEQAENFHGVDIYTLRKYAKSNQGTCINQKPLVNLGDVVQAGDIIADGQSVDLGELALGRNMLVAFMPWNGYNFEDSILVSERVLRDDCYTSIHIDEVICSARDTKLGPEEITADIPNVSEHLLNKLDENGIIRIGAEVKPGDILVGKVTPKGETQLTPEEKLLRAIFGPKAHDSKDTSLRLSAGSEGVVIDVRIFTREGIEKDARTLASERAEIEKMQKDLAEQEAILTADLLHRVKLLLLGQKTLDNQAIDDDYLELLSQEKWLDLRVQDENINLQLQRFQKVLQKLRQESQARFQINKKRIQAGDEMPPSVNKMVKVYIAVKRQIQPGDKMAGRHGNKGVISNVVPEEDMPFMADGQAVDIVLNPLGVPSRMNIGQILEVHLGFAARGLGRKIEKMLRQQRQLAEIRAFLEEVYNDRYTQIDFQQFTDEELQILVKNLAQGIPMATPVFDGASEDEVKRMLRLADLPESGQVILHDGRTGEPFERPVTVGYMYMLKLNHLVDDKMHARSTGPYSLVTQQPLGGKANFGGQRLGEMEVWALEAYGAAYTLQEMLTVKSDDMEGRNKIYKNIVNGDQRLEAGIPESFNVLLKEIRSLGLNIELDQEP